MNRLSYSEGLKIGKLTLLEASGKTSQGNIIWKCKCECGKEVNRATDSLGESIRHGCTISCGCARKKASSTNTASESAEAHKLVPMPGAEKLEELKKDYSNVKGVSQIPGKNKWKARISVNGKATHLGTFNTYEEACEARLKAEAELR